MGGNNLIIEKVCSFSKFGFVLEYDCPTGLGTVTCYCVSVNNASVLLSWPGEKCMAAVRSELGQ